MDYKEMAQLVYQGHQVLDARTVEFSENEFIEIIMQTAIQTAVDDYDEFIEELKVLCISYLADINLEDGF